MYYNKIHITYNTIWHKHIKLWYIYKAPEINKLTEIKQYHRHKDLQREPTWGWCSKPSFLRPSSCTCLLPRSPKCLQHTMAHNRYIATNILTPFTCPPLPLFSKCSTSPFSMSQWVRPALSRESSEQSWRRIFTHRMDVVTHIQQSTFTAVRAVLLTLYRTDVVSHIQQITFIETALHEIVLLLCPCRHAWLVHRLSPCT